MASCAQAVQQPDGSYLLALTPAVTDVTTCAYVVHTGVEEAQGSLLSMTPDDAMQITGAVFALWSAAWVIKQAIRVLNGDSNEANS